MASANRNKELRPETIGLIFKKIVPHASRPEFLVPLDFKYHRVTPSELAKMDSEITYAFGSDIDIFSIASDEEKPQSLMYPFSSAPMRYFRIWNSYFEQKYPAEAEARAYISTYRELYLKNQIRFIAIKRFILAISLVAVFWPHWLKVAGLLAQASSLQTELASIAIGLLFFLLANPLFFGWYRDSHENSSSHVSVLIQGRLNDLSQFFNNTITDIDRAGAHIGRMPDAWNEQSKFLIRLSLYISKRFEYFERFVQLEMWRVRRIRHWTLMCGALTLFGVLATFEYVFLLPQMDQAVAGLGGDWLSLVDGYAIGVLGLRAVILVSLSFASMQWGRVSVTAARDAMQHKNWRRYSELQVDEEIGSQVGRDKRLLAQAAQQHIFQPNPGNPSHAALSETTAAA